jgi:RNA:NAD 2'-phosphotransferase (TPT1/KptA family)
MINGGSSALAIDTLVNDSRLHDYVYHSSSPSNIASIKEHGLRPTPEKDGKAYNYVATTPDAGREVASSKYKEVHTVAIHANHPSVKNLQKDPDRGMPGSSSFRTSSHIPPEAISHTLTTPEQHDNEDRKVFLGVKSKLHKLRE